MKLMHLSDLHLGIRVYEYSMVDDQKYILDKILGIIDEEQPDAILLSGDIYDKADPSAEAVRLFDEFLVSLNQRQKQVFIISGNHDSAERVSYASRILEANGIHVSPVYNGTIAPIELEDQYGKVNFYLLPFIKPIHVNHIFEDTDVKTSAEAIDYVVKKMEVDPASRNVLLAHQYITGGERSESEDRFCGNLDNVDALVFDDFDYVALGHLHGPQSCGRETVRYCGTPLKYSFSEVAHQKSVTIVELLEKGNVTVRTHELIPQYDMIEIKGKFDEITAKDFYEEKNRKDQYVHITLTDEEDIPNAIGKLRPIYSRLMLLDYDNTRTKNGAVLDASVSVEDKSPFELFDEFFTECNAGSMTDEQKKLIREVVGNIWEKNE